MVMADGPRHLQRGPVRVGFYDIEGTLGKGNFAVVKLGRHRITKTEVRPRGSAGAWRGCAPGGGRRAWHCGDRGVQVECVCGGCPREATQASVPSLPPGNLVCGLGSRAQVPRLPSFRLGVGWEGKSRCSRAARGPTSLPGEGDQQLPGSADAERGPDQASFSTGRGVGAADRTGAYWPLSIFSGPAGSLIRCFGWLDHLQEI